MMTIVHNMMMANAERQFSIVTRKKSKHTEKLSSGYRINRAADDASGLSISEKMRRVHRGLAQGVKNTQEGISVCQVADGALEEVNDMLHRISELSIKAANGTLQNDDRAMINEEIKAIKAEINRISETTTFNEIPLFSEKEQLSYGETIVPGMSETGSTDSLINYPSANATEINLTNLSSYASTTDSQGITHYTLGPGIYEIAANITNVVFEVSGTTAIQNSNLRNVSFECSAGTDFYAKNLSIENDQDTFYYDCIGFNGQGNTFSFLGRNTLNTGGSAGIRVSQNTDLIINGEGVLDIKDARASAAIGGSTADIHNGTMCDYGNITIKSGKILVASSAGAGIGTASNPPVNSHGKVVIDGGEIHAHSNVGAGIGSGWHEWPRPGTELAGSAGIVIINGGYVDAYGQDAAAGIGGGVACGGADVTITGGIVIAGNEPEGMYDPYGAGIGCGAVYDTNGDLVWNNGVNPGKLTITGGDITIYGGTAGVTNQLSAYPIGFGAYYSANQQAIQQFQNTFTGTAIIDGNPLSFWDSKTEVASNGRYVFRYQGSNADKGIGLGVVNKTKTGKGIWIHSGNEPGDGIWLTIDEMNTTVMGLDEVSCLTSKNAEKSIERIKNALQYLSSMRSTIGAQQNRLEHTVNNESNIVENTVAAESMIRDTDIAKDMVLFSNMNIIQQAGCSIMSHAQQDRQVILTLLQ